jgi:hypothetical protein
VLPALTRGLADEGLHVDEDVVRFGKHAALVVPSAFSALPLARLAGPTTPADAAWSTGGSGSPATSSTSVSACP